MIFAREISDALTGLVKKIDAATVKHSRHDMGSFVVLCNDDEKAEGRLKDLAAKEGLKKTVLSIVDSRAGPGGYRLDPKADVTVVLYVKRKTQRQFAYARGELRPKDIEEILAALPAILPEK